MVKFSKENPDTVCCYHLGPTTFQDQMNEVSIKCLTAHFLLANFFNYAFSCQKPNVGWHTRCFIRVYTQCESDLLLLQFILVNTY